MKTPIPNVYQFYDTETTGINTQLDQILQFASVPTDGDLNIIESGVANLICKPRLDVIAHPKAYLTHFLDVDTLNAEGMNEFMLTRAIQNIFTETPGTCISGYNTHSFDDNLVRNLMMRNMKDYYQHEYSDGNFRMDVFKMVQLVFAIRPEILNWRDKENGTKSLKLEHLSADNGIAHDNAHDALDDVLATIGVAKKIKEANPRLFNYALQLCNKQNTMALLAKREPLIHIDTVHGQDQNITTLIQPIVLDKMIKTKFLCLDLRHDPRQLLQMSNEEINKFLYTKRAELPEGSPKIPIIGVETNKQPIIAATTGLLTNDFANRANIDLDEINRNREFIRDNTQLAAKIQDAMVSDMPKSKDVYKSIYSGGFLHKDDGAARSRLHFKEQGSESLKIEKVDVHAEALLMRDSVRQFELILRSKWNSFNSHLLTTNFSPTEFRKWVDYLEVKLYEGIEGSLTMSEFYEAVNMVEIEKPLTSNEKTILDKLVAHTKEVEKTVENLREMADELFQESELERSDSKKIQEIERRINATLDYEVKESTQESSLSI